MRVFNLSTLLIAAILTISEAAAEPLSNTGPWMSPGDSGLRSDVQILADAGIILSPVTSWPLSWGDIAGQIRDRTVADLSPYEAAALARVQKKGAIAMQTGRIMLNAEVAVAENPIQIRSFEDTPREDAEIGVGLRWTGDWAALSLQGRWVDDPQDGEEWRADGSYLGVALGNWMLAGAVTDRYWGPGWQSSLIMSNNARPIPAVTLERNSTTPFETKWLKWLGHWDLTLMYGVLESDRVVPNAHFIGARLNFRPLKSLEIGISRTATWCGDGQPCDFSAFLDVLFRLDSVGESDPDQLGGWDARWSTRILRQPVAFYGQFIGEDAVNFFPGDWLGLIGGETWGQSGLLGTYRLFLEWSDTECDFRFYRSLRNDSGPGSPACAYQHATYKSGNRYKGRTVGHSFDRDSSVFTLGAVIDDRFENQFLVTAAIGNLNRRRAGTTTTSDGKSRYRSITAIWRRPLWIGDLQAGLGYDYRKRTANGESSSDVNAFARWSVSY